MGQPWQVLLETAPVAALKVPAGQGVKLVEARGQNDPAGQRMGILPPEQNDPAGQATRVIARMRLLLRSPTYRMPEGLTVTPKGELKREAVPKPS